MSTHTVTTFPTRPEATPDVQVPAAPGSGWMGYVVAAGRVLYSAIFLLSAVGHFTKQTIDYAAQQGVPLASIAVPVSGVLALLGGLSVLLGYRARIGAWLLVLFLVPVTLMMHNFWAFTDPAMGQLQFVMFLKNLSMLGAALIIAGMGAGPLSLDDRRLRRRRFLAQVEEEFEGMRAA
ncbi:MAG TPA: DoxX family protein [Terriglobales bacterium]|nr:DoxX family protein [Terriglobales bacterium]